MHEKRKLPRKQAPDKITVYDRATETAIGQVVNMTRGGVLLLSDSPIPADRVFQLRISLPEPIEGTDLLEFGAESLWESPAMDENNYWTGLQIIDISESDSRILEILIEDWRS
jgi:hypothetical protein